MREALHTLVRVRVVPGSSRDQLLKEEGGYKVKLTAPAVEGRANRALVHFLSKKLKVPRGAIRIVSGETSRRKRVRIEEMTPEEVEKAFSEA